MYSVKKNGEVVALFIEETDAEKFREWKFKALWDELIEEKTLEYIHSDGGTKDDMSNDVLMLIDGLAEAEADNVYTVCGVRDSHALELIGVIEKDIVVDYEN